MNIINAARAESHKLNNSLIRIGLFRALVVRVVVTDYPLIINMLEQE